MAAARLVLCILTALYAVNGQSLFHLREDGVYNGDTRIREFTLSSGAGTSGSDAALCYSGDTLYLANGVHNGATATTTIRSFPSDGSGVETILDTFENVPERSFSLSCCCRYYAYGFNDNGMSYVIRLQPRDTADVCVEYSFDISGVTEISAINLDCVALTVTAVSRFGIYVYSFSSSVAESTVTFATPLPTGPRCLAPFTNGGMDYIAVSYQDAENFDLLRREESGTYTRLSREVITGASVRQDVRCVSVDGTNLYIYARGTEGFTDVGYLFSVTTGTIATVEDPITVPESADSFSLTSPNMNLQGLQVCSGCSTLTCLQGDTNTCNSCDSDPNFDQCGFCSPDGNTCLCENPETQGCIYKDETTENSCLRPTPKLDAYCAVLNPMAMRRSGGVNGVAAIISPSDASNVQSVSIRRGVKTGRWPTNAQPRGNSIPITTQVRAGYETPVQSNARGRRFLFADVAFQRTSAIEEELFCIASERSAFVNLQFTYVVVEGGSITLEVSLGNQFIAQVRWMRTNVDSGATTMLNNDASLTLTIPSATKSNDEGVYECFRFRRYPRTWHPVIYLHVRECAMDRWGPTCGSTCGTCRYGTCDIATGECRCYPGVTGANCDTYCSSLNMIGQNCDIDCNGFFTGTAGNNCVDLELCQQRGFGCHCRPGLRLPDCREECPPGTYGPDCVETCAVGCPTTCNRVDGTCP